MPQVNEYAAPETEAQGPVGGTSPNMEMAGAVGKGMQHLGAGIEEFGDVIYKKNAQQETADIYSTFAQKRAEWGKRLKEQAANGTLNTDDVKQQYEEEVGKLGENITTAEGRNYFERQSARLGGHLVSTASAMQTAMAGDKAQQSWEQGIVFNSHAVHDDPASFADVYNSNLEGVSALIKADPRLVGQEHKISKAMGTRLATAAAKGWADQDPGINPETGAPNENLGKHVLDKGMFDDILDAQQKEGLYHYARTQDENRRVEKNRQLTDTKNADEYKSYLWQKENANKMLDNKISINDLKNSPLLPSEKYHYRGMIEQQSREETRTDPRKRNQLNNDIYNGKITSMDQVFARAQTGGLAPTDVMKAHSLLNLTDEGQRENSNRRSMMAVLKKEIGFKDISGQSSAVGEFKISQAHDEILDLQDQLKQKGEDPKSIYDSKSPNFYGNIVARYRPTAQEAMGISARQGVSDALGQPTSGTQIIRATSPTGQIKQPVAPQAPPPVQDAPTPTAAGPEAQGGPASGKKISDLEYAAQQLGFSGPEADKRNDEQKSAKQKRWEETQLIYGSKRTPPPEAPAASAKQTELNKNIRQPGESAEAFLKRRGV